MKSILTLLFLFICLLSNKTFAVADSTNRLSAGIHRAHQEGTHFEPYHLFTPTSGVKHDAVLKKETLLLPDAFQIGKLYETKPQALTLDIADEQGNTVQLDLLQRHPFADNATIGYIDDKGRHALEQPEYGLHYQGAIAGKEQSIASVSVFADGTITMLFGDSHANYIVGKLEDGSGKYVYYNDRDLLTQRNMPCGTLDVPGGSKVPESTPARRGTAINTCHKVQLYWELDYQLFVARGSLTAAQNYAATLFNNVQTLYNNDGIAVELKTLYIYTTPDAYGNTSSNAGLMSFVNKWAATSNNFDGDLAHLITLDGRGNGGIAYINVLCNRNYAYAYSEVTNTIATVPAYSWDVEVVTHETGHNLGSNHTQWCGWNTGSGGACGSIDNCYTQEPSNGCSTCGATNTADAGTIMSYCHLTSRGINLAYGFGVQPAALIQTQATNSTCLKSIISATITPANICHANDGAISLSFQPTNFGVSPYSYSWSSGASTQNINGLSNPGTYSVAITDINNCTNNMTTSIVAVPSPGNGNPYGGTLPINCNNNAVLAVSAALPTQLAPCQTVAWLRTTIPLTTFAQAQAAFTAAPAGDKLFSDNAANISSTTPAVIRVATPGGCAGAVTNYYTPFVSQKEKPVNTITSTPISSGNSTGPGNITIGRFATLPDATAMATTCDLVAQPSVQEVSVTITGYTGRANNMILQMSNTSGAAYKILYNQVGNGTYTFPLAVVTGSPLQGLVISAYDYNCNSGCVTSTANLAVTRTVTYAAITTPTFEQACTSGNSVEMSYSPAGNAPLPVTLLSFKGTPVGNSNILQWQTATELNMKDFELQRAADGRTFTTLTKIQATNKAENDYAYTDNSALPVSYYRLVMAGLNGEITYSKTITLSHEKMEAGAVLTLFPNPAQQQVTIGYEASRKESVMIHVTDAMGQKIYHHTYPGEKGRNEWKISLSGWAKGIYFVTIGSGGGSVTTQKLVVE